MLLMASEAINKVITLKTRFTIEAKHFESLIKMLISFIKHCRSIVLFHMREIPCYNKLDYY